MGYALTELKQYTRSNEYYREVQKIYITMGDTINLCTILNNIGFNYRDLNDSINSYKVHKEAIALAKHTHDLELLAKCYNKISSSYNHFKNKGKRIEYLGLERDVYIKLDNSQKIAETYENQGDAYADLMKYELAKKSFLSAMSFYEKAKNIYKQAEMYWDYGYQLNNGSKDYDESIRAYRKAYELYMQNKDSADASTMLSNIGQNYWSKLDYQKAIESHRAAIELAKKCKNQKQVATSWSKLSTLYSESNNPVASVEALQNAVEALATVNDSTLLASTCKDLASSYSKSKNYTKAFEFFNKAMAIQRAKKDTLSYASTLYSRGTVYHNKNDYKQAAKDYQDALVLQRKIKDKSGVIYTLTNLGCYSAIG
ncbi:MAG: tetratricopeptide repeat protein [Cyclobacteriaceae bacterium]